VRDSRRSTRAPKRYGVNDAVRARVRLDEVQMVGEHAWVYSTAEVSGRLRFVGAWVVLLSWQRELEVARREAGAWRLFGYQQ
jgi:acetyl-CoA carboxylase alpha subunit